MIDAMLDMSELTDSQRRMVGQSIEALKRFPEFWEVLARAQAQYGTIKITMHDQPTMAALREFPARLNINAKMMEYMYFVSPQQVAVPLTMHRTLAHELFHFAQDINQQKELMFHQAAYVFRHGGDTKMYQRFLGYEGRDAEYAKALRMDENPMSLQQYSTVLEPDAIAFENRVMNALYGESWRSPSMMHYWGGTPFSLQSNQRPNRCENGISYHSDVSSDGVSGHPSGLCFYRYLPKGDSVQR